MVVLGITRDQRRQMMSAPDTAEQKAFTDAQVTKFCKGIKRKGAEAEFPECCFPPNNPFSQNSVPCVMTGISLPSSWSGTVD